MKQEFKLKKIYDVFITIEIVQRNGRFYAQVMRTIDADIISIENDEYECWIDEPDNLMTEENPTESEYDAIIETFCSYIKENSIRYARICDKCGNGMNEGYVVNGGEEYYCTPQCLHQIYTPKEWEKMYVTNDEFECRDNYFTEWDNIGSEYFLFNNQLINI